VDWVKLDSGYSQGKQTPVVHESTYEKSDYLTDHFRFPGKGWREKSRHHIPNEDGSPTDYVAMRGSKAELRGGVRWGERGWGAEPKYGFCEKLGKRVLRMMFGERPANDRHVVISIPKVKGDPPRVDGVLAAASVASWLAGVLADREPLSNTHQVNRLTEALTWFLEHELWLEGWRIVSDGSSFILYSPLAASTGQRDALLKIQWEMWRI
jgi:hypothetical protein